MNGTMIIMNGTMIIIWNKERMRDSSFDAEVSMLTDSMLTADSMLTDSMLTDSMLTDSLPCFRVPTRAPD